MYCRLFLFDWRIIANTLRTTFSRWRDRIIAAALLVSALLFVRSWLTHHSLAVAIWACLGGSAMIGLTAGRLIAARLALHGFDGVLAADALLPAMRRRYMIAWHMIALTVVVAILLAARPSVLIAALAGYPIGACVGHWAGGFGMRRFVPGQARPGRRILSWLQDPRAGIASAGILLLSLPLWARLLDGIVLTAIISAEAVLFALTLASIDYATVRFLTIAGHGSGRIIARHARGPLLFGGLAASARLFAGSPIIAGIIAVATAAALLLMTMRILAYRLHGKRFADLLVLALTGFIALTAVAQPFALPFVVLVILWQLQRRARTRTWLLA